MFAAMAAASATTRADDGFFVVTRSIADGRYRPARIAAVTGDVAAVLHRELAPGEAVAWQGTPRRRAELLYPGNWLFALVWIGFSIGFTMLATKLAVRPPSLAGILDLDADSVLPFVGTLACCGGAMLLIPPVLAVLRAGRTIYAITDRRLLRIKRGARLRTLSIPLRRIDSVVGWRATGWGTIRISATTLQDGRPLGSGAFTLRGVPEAARAYALLSDGVSVSLAL